jgi:NADH-quinone oxidoreductase subunit A
MKLQNATSNTQPGLPGLPPRVPAGRKSARLGLRALRSVSGPSRRGPARFPLRVGWPHFRGVDSIASVHRLVSHRLLPGLGMDALLQSYLPIVIFLALAIAIGLALLVSPFIVAYKAPDAEKLSAYECGFNAFDDARMKFDVRFYLVAILFIIFDLEVAFLFPWAVAFSELGWFGFWSMMIFLAVLTIGFVYEWRKGALEWD